MKNLTNTDTKSTKCIIMIDYINSDNKLINHKVLTGKVGQSFKVSQCELNVPKGYRFCRILTGRKIKAFNLSPQIMVAQITKAQYVYIDIKYISISNNKQINEVKNKLAVGTPINMHRYFNMIPEGYKLYKVKGIIPKFIKHNQIIYIDVISSNFNHHLQIKNDDQSHDDKSSKEIGAILVKLASSLNNLGLYISKNHKL